MTFRRTATALAAALATLGLGATLLAGPAHAQAAETSVTFSDKAGDQKIDGNEPDWVKKTARSRESDLRRVRVAAIADNKIRAVFKLEALKKGRFETEGKAAYQGKYHRRWLVTLSSMEEWGYFSWSFGYEETVDGRRRVLDKPRVFVAGENGSSKCADGTARIRPKTDTVIVTVPAKCAAGVDGSTYDVAGYAKTLGYTTDDVWLDYGTDYATGTDQVRIPAN